MDQVPAGIRTSRDELTVLELVNGKNTVQEIIPPLKIRSQPRSIAADIRTTCQRWSAQVLWKRAVLATDIDRRQRSEGCGPH